MAHEMALMTINTIKTELTQLVSTIIQYTQSGGKITTLEGFQLGFQAMMLGQSILTAVEGGDAAAHADLLWCLQHGTFTVPDTAPSGA